MANNGFKATDFSSIPFNDWKRTVTRIPVGKGTDFYGDETFTDSSTASMEAIFMEVPRNSDTWIKMGVIGGADAIIYVLPSQTLVKEDKITADSRTYRAEKVTTRILAGITMYKVAPLFLIDETAQ